MIISAAKCTNEYVNIDIKYLNGSTYMKVVHETDLNDASVVSLKLKCWYILKRSQTTVFLRILMRNRKCLELRHAG